MNNNSSFKTKLRKFTLIFLIITLILGILASSFGIGVIALSNNSDESSNTSNQESNDTSNGNNTTDTNDKQNQESTFESPTEEYKDLDNEVDLNDDVVVLSDKESKLINKSIISVENVQEYYSGSHTNITLKGENLSVFEDISNGDVIYLQGDQNTPFGEDRFMKVDYISSYNEETHIQVSEPYFEDVFDSMEICSSNLLTKENFVDAYYAKGVKAHFGNIDKEMTGVSKTNILEDPEATNLLGTSEKKATPLLTATDNVSKGSDLIVKIDYEFGNDDKKEDEEDSSVIDSSFGITGQFGVRDMQAHLVCDMPRAADFEELYFGLSGETFVDVDLKGEVTADAEAEASKKDFWLASLEGLNEKRFPIAVLKFEGTTPVKITHSQFDKSKDSIIPSLYVMIYADWEGHISMGIEAGFEYSHAFNGGLRIFKEGEPCLSFEQYPYTSAYDAESEDGLVWNVKANLSADTDLTLLGGSVVFYIGGINIGEVSIARLGAEAKCNLNFSIDSKDKKFKILEKEETELFIRGYLKFIEAKVKLKAEGKSFLNKLSIDIDYEFGLLDLTLFEYGSKPDKYKPKVPISSMSSPADFETVITLVCDVSGSMDSTISTGQTKLEAAQESAKVIVNTTKEWPKEDKENYGIGVVMFSDYAETVTSPHIDYDYINDCIDSMGDGGGTSIHSGIDCGVEQLKTTNAKSKVMILMTDGQDSNDSATIESAQNAASEGIKIFVIGFGDDVDEEILKQIATETNGEYRFASTESIVGIMGSFMYAQQASTANVLAEVEATVAEGETSEKTTFFVDDKNGKLIASTAWPGSFLDTILVDPNGRTVDENYPGSVTDESKIPSTIMVESPIFGEWSICVKGIETSYDQEPFYTIVSFKQGDGEKANGEMGTLESIAAYCIAIGVFTTLTSAMFLFCFAKSNRKN